MAETDTGFTRLVLYDGVCGFCDGLVRWLIERDPEGRLRFAPLQGETAAALRERHPEIPEDLDTVVFVEVLECGERVSLRSEAIFRLMEEVGGVWRAVTWLRVLPRPLADLLYRAFARVRYRIFGRLSECRIPDAAERARFLT